MTVGHPVARRVVLAAGRRARSLARGRMARRVFGFVGLRVSGTGARLPMGSSFPAGYAPNVPVVVIVAAGLDDESVRTGLRVLADVQLATSGFRPLVITDQQALGLMQEFGWSTERILSEAEYLEQTGRSDWWTYVNARVADAVNGYGASAVQPMPTRGYTRTDFSALLTLRATLG